MHFEYKSNDVDNAFVRLLRNWVHLSNVLADVLRQQFPDQGTAQGVSGGTDRPRPPVRGLEPFPHHHAPRVPLDPPVQDAAGPLQYVLSPRRRDRGGQQAAEAGTGRQEGGAAAGAARPPPAAA
eukprot:gene2979-biopygen6605